MTLSMKLALESINEKKGNISYYELGYFLTVLRDNSDDDRVYKFLNHALKIMYS